MAFNPEGGNPRSRAQQIQLNIFGGLVTEVPAANLPEGASPDNQDIVFGPAVVRSREGLHRQFGTPFGNTVVTNGGTYIDNLGIKRNLYLDAAGTMWLENVTDAPGLATPLATTTPGSYLKVTTAFGNAYLAISDGLHGTEVPLQYDGTSLDRVTQDGPGAPPNIANLAYDAVDMDPVLSGTNTMERTDNVVTVATAAPHNLQEGYRVEIANVTAAAVDTLIDTIVIDAAQKPGTATVTMTAAHGLAPGTYVAIHDVPNTEVATITVIRRTGGVVLIVTVDPHGLQDGVPVELIGAPTGYDNGFTIAKVLSPTAFTFFMDGADDTPAASGTVHLVWPFPNTGANAVPGSVFEVLSCPTDTSFIIPINYASGTWAGGGVTVPWVGTYTVTEVLSTTQFQYTQYAPDQITTEIGTVTPFGQVAPGKHQMQVLFRTRNGYTTAPSPPVTFTANGGQYLHVTNIPIGPDNVEARILAFTGAGGAYFYYIPVPAQVNGQKVSTSTVVEDNSSVEVILDFSDNTLFAALGINLPGNNLPAQIVIDGALNFGYFGSRLLTWGQRNRIQNLKNMGFDGGYAPLTPTIPTGWTADGGGAGGEIDTGHYGFGWQITGAGFIYQTGYLDAYGAPILLPNTRYRLRGWVQGAGASATVMITSASTGFAATATLSPGTAAGAWLEDDFDLETPATIPEDIQIELSGGGSALIDELSIIYAENPYTDRIINASYINNPEAFDGVTGVFGPVDDTHKVMACAVNRALLYVLTRDPNGRVHQVSDNGATEPAGWAVPQIASACGLLSAFGLTQSQANDATGSGGEDWLAWASYAGLRIFSGSEPWKISQEIQPDWNTINPEAAHRIAVLNDPVKRRIYCCLPIDEATAPSLIYHVDYKFLDSAHQIAEAAPIIRGGQGRLVSRDLCRKWTRWNLTMNGAALMFRDENTLEVMLFAGNGEAPVEGSQGQGNVYYLDPLKLSDDDFGAKTPYYITYFFPGMDADQALGLGAQRKTLQFFQYLVRGTGRIRVTAYANTLSNPWPLNTIRTMREDPKFDDEWPGANVTAQRMAFKFEPLPLED